MINDERFNDLSMKRLSMIKIGMRRSSCFTYKYIADE